MKYTTPIWDYPPELQPRCRLIAVGAWLFVFLTFGSWSLVPAAILSVPVSFVMMRWLRGYGTGRFVTASILFASSVLGVLGFGLGLLEPRIMGVVQWVPPLS